MNTIELQLDYTKILSILGVTKEEKGKGAEDFGQNLAYLLDRNGCDPYYSRSILLTTINAHISDKTIYHTPFHVLSILSFAQKNEISLEDWELLAIFYHDVIYRPTSKRNEVNSIQFMLSLLSDTGISSELLSKAANGIQATAMHLDNDVDPNAEKLLDLDLHTFTYEPEAFGKVNESVKMEFYRENDKNFKGYTKLEYLNGRRSFLNKLNSKKSFFRTPWFKENFENIAKQNLKNEIELTENQLINI
jgi:predicted metal-dependent HD superfamily phosphohydrolase